MEENKLHATEDLKLQEIISRGSLNFNGWTSLISEIDRTYPDDLEKICLVYDSFLSKFPLCHGYWRKYAAHKARLSTVNNVLEVFERAVQSATYSVGVWVDYCVFSMSAFDDPVEVRRLFKRGLSFVGKDYACHMLWDRYIEYEFSRQQWDAVARVYILALRFPTKKLHSYYNSFKKLISICKEELGCEINCDADVMAEAVHGSKIDISSYEDDEISRTIIDLQDSSCSSKTLEKYFYIGELVYQEACQLDAKIHSFESRIKRTHFHVKPLDNSQLENWHHYLDFIEIQGDFDWAVKLHERCLIPCANYPEFWMRYADFMETKGGREIANFALDRALHVFLRSASVIHLFHAWFNEKIGDVIGARAAFLHRSSDPDSNFVDNVMKEANMERRLGNFAAAYKIYKVAIEMAEDKKKLHTLPLLYVQYFRLKYKITGCISSATDVLIEGIKHVPRCKLLFEEMIKVALLHGDPGHFNLVDSIITEAISPGQDASEGLSVQDQEEISILYLEFIDLCGSIEDVKNAWNRHIKLFPHSVRSSPSYEHPAPTTHLKLDRRSDTVVQLAENDALFDNKLNDHPQTKVDGTVREGSQRLLPEVLEQSGGSTPELLASSVDFVHQTANSADYLENIKACDVQQKHEEVSPEASQENPSTSNDQQEHDHEPEQDGKPLSLQIQSLDPQVKESFDSIPTEFNEFKASQQICVSHRSELQAESPTDTTPISNPMGTEMTDFAIEWHCPLSKQRSPVLSRADSQPPVSPDNDGKQNKRSNVSSPRYHRHSHGQKQLHTLAENDSEMLAKQGYSCESLSQDVQMVDFASEYHSSLSRHRSPVPGHALSQPTVSPYKRSKISSSGYHSHSHDQQQLRTQAENEAQMLVSESYPCQFLSQVTEAQQGSQPPNQYQGDGVLGPGPHWQMPNMWQQSFESASSQIPSVACSPSGTSQVPPQKSNMEYANTQNWEAYNQMWQHYYYQQQLVLQQQVQVQQLPHQHQPEQERLLLRPELQRLPQQQQQQHNLPQQQQQQHNLPQQHNQQQILHLQLQQQQYYMQQMQQQQQFYHHLQLQQQQLLQMQQLQLQQLQAQQQPPNQQELHQERQPEPEQLPKPQPQGE